MLVSLISLLLFSQHSMAAGFSSGSRMSAVSISGQVSVACSTTESVGQTSLINCYGSVLEPSPYDTFIGPIYSEASKNNLKVNLKVAREDGSIRSKLNAYNGLKGQSELFNLWIKNLFQTPILGFGVNKIQYSVQTPQGAVLDSGQFEVLVEKGNSRVCRSVEYNSSEVTDCTSEYTICQKYFQELNNCR